MKITQISAELRSIYDKQIDTADGAHWSNLVTEFNARFPEARFEIGADLFDKALKDQAIHVVSATDRQARAQLSLPGMDVDWDATVTLPDSEGGFRRKRLEHATVVELTADYDLHVENVDRAQAALKRATNRNDTLVPLMETHGFRTAGEAIEYLTDAS